MCAALAILSACSGSKSKARSAVASGAATTSAAASPTLTPRALADEIGDRGGLPAADPIDLASRYGLTQGRAPASKPFAGEQAVDSTRSFRVLQLSGSALAHESPPRVVTVAATLKAKSAHAYFYEDDALNVSSADVQAAADQFEASVWPKVTAAFGEPLIPGVDGDPRIIVLQSDLGGGVGGYFSIDDEFLRSVRPLSNEAEMVYLNRTLAAGSASFNVVLAHEFQHLIHAKNDINEEAWVNEALSEDASMLVGGAASTIDAFEKQPRTQLDAWDGSIAHYGAGAAFFRYLTSRFGGDQSYGVIAREPGNGAAGVDQFLAQAGSPLHFRDVFADWIAANIVNARSGPYANPERPLDVPVTETLALGSPAGGSANQFGTDYYDVALDNGDYVLNFSGQPTVDILPTKVPATGPLIWGNAGDSVDTTLTRTIDLTGAADPALTFKTWYDIEHWYDWGYVSASTDGGKTWRALAGNQTTTDDPAKAAYGPGYTGESGGGQKPAWVDERVSLAKFAGQRIMLRFEYVTDGATHGEGWAIAHVAISGAPAAVNAADGWQSAGWVRIDAPLKQTYVVRLIEQLTNGDTKVVDVPLDANERGALRVSAAGIKAATLAIAGSTEGTNQPAPYKLTLSRP